MRALFKVMAVFVTVVSVAMMGASLATYFVHPDVKAEMSTPEMQNYTFEVSSGENPQWTVTRRFSTDLAQPALREKVGAPFKTAYDALIAAHKDRKNYLTQQTAPLAAAKTTMDQQTTQFDATQNQDVIAIAERAKLLQQFSDEKSAELQARSEELQALSVKSKEVRDETAARRTDVLRLRHEVEEARTDLFRLTAIRRDLADRLVRLEIENQGLKDRQDQLDGGATVPYEKDQTN